MSEAGDGPRPNADGTAEPHTPAGPGGPTATQGTDQGLKPPSWRALITGLLIALVMATIMVTTNGRLLWWRGAKRRRSLISPEEEGGIAALPPA
ncbi:hypothetical protein [Embleya sp. NPDC005575]|uniref:hypothetical protein n=1 Tax=Embleya sp. NPDC005575 TaxID=3156892 RepID=UPI0033A2770F